MNLRKDICCRCYERNNVPWGTVEERRWHEAGSVYCPFHSEFAIAFVKRKSIHKTCQMALEQLVLGQEE